MLAASLDHPELVTMIVPAPTSIWGDRAILRLLADGSLGDLRTMRLVWGGSVSGGAADPGAARSAIQRQQHHGRRHPVRVHRALARRRARRPGTHRDLRDLDRSAGRTAHLDVPDYVAIQAEFPGRVHARSRSPRTQAASRTTRCSSDRRHTARRLRREDPRARTDGLRHLRRSRSCPRRSGLAGRSRIHRRDPGPGRGPSDRLRNGRPLHALHRRRE